jgi:hypothetical protein
MLLSIDKQAETSDGGRGEVLVQLSAQLIPTLRSLLENPKNLKVLFRIDEDRDWPFID